MQSQYQILYRIRKSLLSLENLLSIGFGPDIEKNDTVLYVPILRTLRLLLSHEHVHGEVFKGTTENTEVVIR